MKLLKLKKKKDEKVTIHVAVSGAHSRRPSCAFSALSPLSTFLGLSLHTHGPPWALGTSP